MLIVPILASSIILNLLYNQNDMENQARKIVDQMFEAFDQKDLEKVVATFTEDAICIYHGTQKMPSAKFKGKDGAAMFFEFNFNNFKVVKFQKNQFVQQDHIVVVFGEEHFISNQTKEDLYQKWVQVYTITDGLISRMEEFATSALDNEYAGNA